MVEENTYLKSCSYSKHILIDQENSFITISQSWLITQDYINTLISQLIDEGSLYLNGRTETPVSSLHLKNSTIILKCLKAINITSEDYTMPV